MKKVILFISLMVVMSLSACLRLDSNLYNLSDKITEYKFDNYTGEQDFILDASYSIPDSLIHLFTLNSRDEEGNSRRIYAVYIGDINAIATDTVILYCHGNKWHMDFYWQRAKLMANAGGKNRYGVLMFDYQGYGLSEGTASEFALYQDTRACITWLKQNGLTSDRFVMYGFSLGTAPVCEILAHGADLTASKFFLEAPFASAETIAQDGAGFSLPGSFVTNLKIDNAEEIKSIQQPFCWMHGTADNFLGINTNGEVVYNNYNGIYKEAHRIEGADHGEIPATMGFTVYLQMLENFLIH